MSEAASKGGVADDFAARLYPGLNEPWSDLHLCVFAEDWARFLRFYLAALSEHEWSPCGGGDWLTGEGLRVSGDEALDFARRASASAVERHLCWLYRTEPPPAPALADPLADRADAAPGPAQASLFEETT